MRAEERGTEGTARQGPPSLLSSRLVRLTACGGLLLLVLLAAAALVGHHRRTLALEREATAREAEAVISAVEAGLDSHARGGSRYLEEAFHTYLQALVETSAARAIAVLGEDGSPVVSAGDASLLDDPSHLVAAGTGAGFEPGKGRARFQRRLGGEDPQGRRGRGRGAGRRQIRSELPSATHIAIVMDTGDLESRLVAARRRLGGSLAALMALALMGLVAMRLSWRHSALKEELAGTRERAAQHERLSRLGAGLAHETRNPLGVVRGLMQTIASDPATTSELRKTAREALDEVDRTVGRISSFLQLARPSSPEPVPVEMGPLLEKVAMLLRTEASYGVQIELEVQKNPLVVSADQDMLRRALFNLGLNSLAAMGSEGRLLFMAARSPDGSAFVRVEDDGAGIAAQDLPRVTEPYFSRSPGGSGLGLSIVERIADAHNWRLEIESEQDRGTRVTLSNLRPVR